jgi:hypothetical protein
LPPFHDAGDQDKQAGRSQRGRNQFKMAEELLDLRLFRSAKEGFLNDPFEYFSNNSSQHRGPDDKDDEAPKGPAI